MRTLYYVGLEPLKERYTGAWSQWLPSLFATAFEVVDIPGTPLASVVEKGTFLDVNSSAHYKATQLAHIAEMFHKGDIEEGSVFWFSDIEFNGLEMVRYLSRLNNVPVKIVGFLHAGSYYTGDIMEAVADVGAFAEPLWLKCCDAVFVGSAHSARIFTSARLDPLPREMAGRLRERLVVTGNPFRSHEVIGEHYATLATAPRRFDVVFPHRPDADKRPDLAVRALYEAAEGLPRFLSVAFTTGRGSYRGSGVEAMMAAISEIGEAKFRTRVDVAWRTGLGREEFFATLRDSHSVLSTSVEETFGYAMVEGMAAGCIPIVPWAFAYTEYAHCGMRYDIGGAPSPEETVLRVAGAVRSAFNVRGGACVEKRIEARNAAARFDASEWKILRAIQTVVE